MKILEKISSFFGRYMALVVLAVAALALTKPETCLWIDTAWINYLLMVIMFGMGLTLKWSDFHVVFVRPKEIVIGVGAAFQTEIRATITGIPLEEVIRNVRAGIEEEGMTSRVVKVLDTSDVGFMALQSAKLSGSGIGIGIQSKGTTVIHQKDLYPLTNLELFPQAPLMTLDTYRKIGRNAAKYVKGEKVTPIESTNDPMVRAKFQVKAALMHIIETEQLDPEKGMIKWEV